MDSAYLFLDNKVVGPYSVPELRQMLASGQIQEEILCNDGASGEWMRLDKWMAMAEAPAPAAAKALAPMVGGTGQDAPRVLKVDCPFCSQSYEVDAVEYAGHDVICEACKKTFHIPGSKSGAQAQPQMERSGSAPSPSSSKKNADASAIWTECAREIPNGDLLCPHCWKNFDSDNLLYIATHPSLVGDPILGEFAQKRFVPSVFNEIGQPLDECGLPATDTACPRCHLPYPTAMIDNPSLYFSIAGATSSGKSYFLTCLIHLLRRFMPRYFNAGFYDVNPRMNETIGNYEKQLFMAMDPNQVTALPATQIAGDGISNRILLNGVEIELPQPFVFGFRPVGKDAHESNLIFYDNSGEMFIPGRDEWVNQATFHLSHSNGIVFLFDPTNDANMRRKLCDEADPQVSQRPRSVDQLVLLNELISRIRRHTNMAKGEACQIPLVIAIGKYDTWREHFDRDLSKMTPVVSNEDTLEGSLDMDMIADVSFAARELMLGQMPELVETAERFFKNVYFIPVSAFGTHAEMSPDGFVGVVPSKISPIWLEVPTLILMEANGLIHAKAPSRGVAPMQCDFKVKYQDGQLVFRHPVTEEIVRLPASYGGRRIFMGGKPYQLPNVSSSAESPRSESNPWK